MVVVGTSAINCGISSSTLYYISVKGFPRSINELVQLMGRLKRSKGDRVKQDRIHHMLSLPLFSTMYFTILSEVNDRERTRQLQELMTLAKIIMCQNKCIRQSIEEYYGSVAPDPPLTCGKLCPSCRSEAPKVIKRNVLIDHLEDDVFDTGSVTLGLFASKLMAKKGSIWVAKSMDIKASDAHELTITLWIHDILCIHWDPASVTKGGTMSKKDLHCLKKKNSWIRYKNVSL